MKWKCECGKTNKLTTDSKSVRYPAICSKCKKTTMVHLKKQ